MSLLRKIRVLNIFYLNYFGISFIITIIYQYLVVLNGYNAIFQLIGIKTFLVPIIFLIQLERKKNEFLYFKNLGFSKFSLGVWAYIIDILISTLMCLFILLFT